MMSDTVIAALLAAGATLLVCMVNNYYQGKRIGQDHENQLADFVARCQQSIALIEVRLSEMTKQVEKHNQVIERTYNLEQKAAVLEDRIKVANNRIKDLEEKEKENGN